MIPSFDIFRIERDGSVRWCETAGTLEAAEARVRELGESAPGQYVIFNQQSGERTVFGVPSEAAPTPPNDSARPGSAWYHICRVDKEKLRWVEAAESLQIAEARIKVLKAFYPGDYLVLDYNPERSDSPAPWTALTFVLSAFSW